MKIEDLQKRKMYGGKKPKHISVKVSEQQLDFMKENKISPTALFNRTLEEVGFVEV